MSLSGYTALKNIPPNYIFCINNLANSIFKFNYFCKPSKTSIIWPIQKSDNLSEPTNYRQILVLASFSNVILRFMRNQLEVYIHQKNIIMPEQIGFSPEHQLLRVADYLSEKFIIKFPAAATFLYDSNTLENVWYEGLKYKLIKLKCLAI